MEWAQIPDRDRERLLALHQNKDEGALIWEANRYGMKYLTLKRRLQELNAKRVNPDDTRHNWVDQLRITTDDMVFISDIEIPDQHEELLEYAKIIGKVYEIPNCLWAGDVNASDQFSNFPVSWQVKEEAYEVNLKTTRRLFTEFGETYLKQYFINGNHDNRFSLITGGNLWLGSLFDIPNFTFSRYPFAFINSCRGLVEVAHPHKNFSENAIELGRKMIANAPIPSHLVLAHTHQGQRGWSKNGVHEIIALGCIRDPLKTQYKSISRNTYGEWQPGFAFMKNGYFYQLNYYSTDWSSVLRGNLIS